MELRMRASIRLIFDRDDSLETLCGAALRVGMM